MSVPTLFGFSTSLDVESSDLSGPVRSKLDKISGAAIRKPLLEGALHEIQDNPGSSKAQFQQGWLMAGVDRSMAGVAGSEPEYLAYSEVFPFVKDWANAQR
jgi:hypothetical protein